MIRCLSQKMKCCLPIFFQKKVKTDDISSIPLNNNNKNTSRHASWGFKDHTLDLFIFYSFFY